MRILSEIDGYTHLLPVVGVQWNRMEGFSRDYYHEVMHEAVTHQLWIRVMFWKWQRTICFNFNLP